MNVNDLKNIQEDSFNTWFDRWYKKQDLENKLKVSASKGFRGYRIPIKGVEGEYLRRRLSDVRTIESLKEKLIGFDVKRVHEDEMRVGMWGIKYRHYVDEILISW